MYTHTHTCARVCVFVCVHIYKMSAATRRFKGSALSLFFYLCVWGASVSVSVFSVCTAETRICVKRDLSQRQKRPSTVRGLRVFGWDQDFLFFLFGQIRPRVSTVSFSIGSGHPWWLWLPLWCSSSISFGDEDCDAPPLFLLAMKIVMLLLCFFWRWRLCCTYERARGGRQRPATQTCDMLKVAHKHSTPRILFHIWAHTRREVAGLARRRTQLFLSLVNLVHCDACTPARTSVCVTECVCLVSGSLVCSWLTLG